MRFLAFIPVVLAMTSSACRGPGPRIPADANDATDAGILDASSAGLAPCELSDAAIDAELNIDIDAGVASNFPAEQTSWTVISQAGDCAAVRPGALPPRLVTTASSVGQTSCDEPGAVVDGKGNLAFNWISSSGAGRTATETFGVNLVRPDGGSAVVSTSFSGAFGPAIGVEVARPTGFWLAHQYCDASHASRYVFHELGPTGEVGAQRTAEAEAIVANPDGGYVEVRWVMGPDYNSTQLRWSDWDLSSRTEWQTVIHRPNYLADNGEQAIAIAASGNALVLSFMAPPGFGPPPPPSSWVFLGQWGNTNGPFGPSFTPTEPEWYSSGQMQWPAGWGTFLPLLDGGVVAHQEPTFGDGHPVSPAGWYAYFSEGGGQSSAPAWLQDFETAAMLSNRSGYAATKRDAVNCSRTAVLISPSGQSCYSLDLPGSDDCGSTAAFAADGTLILHNRTDCHVTWWPGLARQNDSESTRRR